MGPGDFQVTCSIELQTIKTWSRCPTDIETLSFSVVYSNKFLRQRVNSYARVSCGGLSRLQVSSCHMWSIASCFVSLQMWLVHLNHQPRWYTCISWMLSVSSLLHLIFQQHKTQYDEVPWWTSRLSWLHTDDMCLLSHRSRQRLSASQLSICLFVCLSVCRQNAKKQFSQKLSTLQLRCLLATYRKSHMGFSKNPSRDP